MLAHFVQQAMRMPKNKKFWVGAPYTYRQARALPGGLQPRPPARQHPGRQTPWAVLGSARRTDGPANMLGSAGYTRAALTWRVRGTTGPENAGIWGGAARVLLGGAHAIVSARIHMCVYPRGYFLKSLRYNNQPPNNTQLEGKRHTAGHAPRRPRQRPASPGCRFRLNI